MRSFALAVSAAVLVLPGQLMAKPTVAVSRIEAGNNEELANNFTVMVETAVETSNKFRVIERRQLGNLVNEQAMGNSGMVTTNTPGQRGGFEGVDYLIYGSITSGSVSRKHSIGSSLMMGMLSGRAVNCEAAVATLVVNVKITDAHTGEVRYAKEITETNQSSTTCGETAQIDTTGLLKDAASKVANGLVMAVYPIQIAAVQADGTIMLNYGESALTPGNYYTVFQKGEEIRDPASGEVLGSTESKLGVIRITEVSDRFSKATPVTAFAVSPPIGSIVRASAPADMPQSGKKR